MAVFGEFVYGEDTYGPDVSVRVIVKNLSKSVIQIELPNGIVVDNTFLNPSTYSLTSGSSNIEHTILPGSSGKSTDLLYLLVKNLVVGATYTLRSEFLQVRDGSLFKFAGTFTARDTKVDSMNRSIPKHFAKDPTSNIGGIMLALGSSDDLIGGVKYDFEDLYNASIPAYPVVTNDYIGSNYPAGALTMSGTYSNTDYILVSWGDYGMEATLDNGVWTANLPGFTVTAGETVLMTVTGYNADGINTVVVGPLSVV